jgi:Spy/CpxP family protein refolding chaperone
MIKILVLILAVGAGAARAQHGYRGEESRDIKALSSEEVAQYLAGAGMGYAKAAELNHFPGPMHVLEFADRLGLSSEQRAATEKLMQAHKAQAREIGAKLVVAERELELLFRRGKVDAAALAEAVRKAAALEGEYRLSHLETHRRTRELLTEEQVKRYDVLRGYSSPQPAHKHKH